MPVSSVRASGLATHPVFKHQATVSEDGAALPRLHRLNSTLPVSPPPSFGSREEWINSLPSWRRMKHRWIGEDDLSAYVDEQCGVDQFFRQGLADADNASAIKGQCTQVYTPPSLSQQDGVVADEDVEMLPEYRTPDSSESQCDYFSPNRDPSSSPVGPLTPFQEYVDRAIAAFDPSPSLYTIERTGAVNAESNYHHFEELKSVRAKTPPCAVSETPVPQSSSDAYKRLVQPLSEWLADYMWQRCYPDVSPRSSIALSGLATSIHSLLLSTLLQPSAIFLALWYIGRLPSRGMAEDVQQRKELLFRQELLGSPTIRSATDASVPFHLFVLGCTLANKWLDDHTFSNKTWHTITNIPIQSINRLEALALDLFTYDLSISRGQWAEWLANIKLYHLSLSSGHIQPISRPSSNPHAIIRKAIEDLIKASSTSQAKIEPSFIGLEERKQEQTLRAAEQAKASAALDIDLDEDGPLREEYKPKRRCENGPAGRDNSVHGWSTLSHLPPPSKWSPAGDEPILRERNGRGAPLLKQAHPEPGIGQFMPIPYSGYGYTGYGAGVWSVHGYIASKATSYAYHPQHYLPMNSVYTAGPFYAHVQPPYAIGQQYGRSKWCSYAQQRFEHQCSDIRTTANVMLNASSPPGENVWQPRGSFATVGAPGMYTSSWIRT